MLDAFSHHRALLTRNRQQVRFHIRINRFAEGEIQILVWPVGVKRFELTVFQVADMEVARELLRRSIERSAGCVVQRSNAAIHAKTIGNQGMAEQPAFDFGQWQHADDGACALREQVMRAVAEGALDHVFPAHAMKEGGFRAGEYKFIPARRILGLQDAHRHGQGTQLGLPKKMRSIRSHWKSLSRRVSRPSMRDKLT